MPQAGAGVSSAEAEAEGRPGGLGLQKEVLAEGHLVALSAFATARADSGRSLTTEARGGHQLPGERQERDVFTVVFKKVAGWRL